MKKYILLILFVMISFLTFSTERWYTATGFSAKTPAQTEFSEWRKCNIPIMIDVEKKRVVIKSQETQIIDWENLEQKYQDGDMYFVGYATDIRYTTIKLEIWIQQTQIVVRIYYSDIEYQYVIHKSIELGNSNL